MTNIVVLSHGIVVLLEEVVEDELDMDIDMLTLALCEDVELEVEELEAE